jgi:hypothetical protein
VDINKKFPFESGFVIQENGIKLKEVKKPEDVPTEEDDVEEKKKFPKKSKIELEPEVEIGVNQI